MVLKYCITIKRDQKINVYEIVITTYKYLYYLQFTALQLHTALPNTFRY